MNKSSPKSMQSGEISKKDEIAQMFVDQATVSSKQMLAQISWPQGMERKDKIRELTSFVVDLINEEVISQHPKQKGVFVLNATLEEQLAWVEVAIQRYGRISGEKIIKHWEEFDAEPVPPKPDIEIVMEIPLSLQEQGTLFVHPGNLAKTKGVITEKTMFGTQNVTAVWQSHLSGGMPMMGGTQMPTEGYGKLGDV